ncbi:putative glyoxal oxidase, galactose oxidase, central domain superfamily [Helianthus annuus]|nr:putative glyoxal oxidase, galactose oxidase, central domain superfamily [Helianthus annuus]
MVNRRWYATNHVLPDGWQIVIGGRQHFNYEFYPKTMSSDKAYSLAFLVQTNDPVIENNLYPFMFLNTDGNLFIFTNNRAILFDYSRNQVLKIRIRFSDIRIFRCPKFRIFWIRIFEYFGFGFGSGSF